MTAMKTATLLLIAAVACAGAPHGKASEDALDAGAGRELLNSGSQWGGQRQRSQPQPKTSNTADIQNPTSQNAQTGSGGNGGNGGFALLDGNSIAIALLPIGGGSAIGGNTEGGSYANGAKGGNGGSIAQSSQNGVFSLLNGRKLLDYWGSAHPQPTGNTNKIKVFDFTGQSATTGAGGNGGNGGYALADGNSLAAALSNYFGSAKGGNIKDNSFANGGKGGNGGSVYQSSKNDVATTSYAGRKLLNGSKGWGSQPQQGSNANKVKIINWTDQIAYTGAGGNGGNGGYAIGDGNAIAVALLPWGGQGAKSGDTKDNSFANGGKGGNGGSAYQSSTNDVTTGIIGGGK